jgi:hypothetical protein
LAGSGWLVVAGLGGFAALPPDASPRVVVFAVAWSPLPRLGCPHWQILIGTLLGVAFGLWLGDAADAMKNVGKLFIGLLKMLIAPLILLTIVHGVSTMGEARQIGRLGSRTVGLYLLTMVLAVATVSCW